MPLRDLTQGPIARSLVVFSIPLFGANLLQTGYNIVDTFFVGRVGPHAVAAVSVSFTVVFVLVSIAGGLTVGTSTMISQYMGARDEQMVRRTIANSMVLIGALSVVLGIVGIAVSGPVLAAMGVPADVYGAAAGYLRYVFAGLPFLFLYFNVTAILRGAGDARTPLGFAVVANGLNVILDPILIFGWGPIPRMEVIGAALASLIGQGVAAVMAVRYLLRGGARGVRLSLDGFRFDGRIVRTMIRLGLPAAVGQAAVALAGTAVVSLVAEHGTEPLAAFGIGTRVDSLSFMASMAMSLAVAAFVGQNLGAGLEERARRGTIVGAAIIAAAQAGLTGLLLAAPETVIRVFNGDPAVVAEGVRYLRVVALAYAPFGVMFAVMGALRGAGDMVVSTAGTIGALWGVRVPAAIILSRSLGLGPLGVWWAIFLSQVVGAVLTVVYFVKGPWARRALVRGPAARGGGESGAGAPEVGQHAGADGSGSPL